MTVIRLNPQIGRDGAAPYEYHSIAQLAFHLKQYYRTIATRGATFTDSSDDSEWSGSVGDVLQARTSDPLII